MTEWGLTWQEKRAAQQRVRDEQVQRCKTEGHVPRDVTLWYDDTLIYDCERCGARGYEAR